VPPENSVCGLIEYHSQTGAWDGTLTVSGKGEVIQLYGLDLEASRMMSGYQLPGYFKIYDPIYYSTDNMQTFSRIEQVSACP